MEQIAIYNDYSKTKIKYTYDQAINEYKNIKSIMLDNEQNITGFSSLASSHVLFLIIADMANKIQDLEEKINTLTSSGTPIKETIVIDIDAIMERLKWEIFYHGNMTMNQLRAGFDKWNWRQDCSN